MTIGQILKICANECGMGYRIFGIDEKSRIPYVWRQGESAAAFLNRIAAWEGAVLKTYAGRFTMIGIREAQKLPAHETITIAVNQEGINYAKQENKKYRTLTIKTADFPLLHGTATQNGEPIKQDAIFRLRMRQLGTVGQTGSC